MPRRISAVHKKILLHTCCAPCATYTVQALLELGYSPTLFWYNPNIHPFTEYKKRLLSFRDFAIRHNLPTIEKDFYGLRYFLANVSSNTLFGVRCNFCYFCRLEKTAETAKENGYPLFTTTLLYSVFQNHRMIKQLGEQISRTFGVGFLYKDFRDGYGKGIELAKAEGMYRQKYCGCIFSEEERFGN
ncbi:MAG: hypothetical protein B6D65_00735 [candidate division Zixibacteria bacterium 4484_93]|nr:MAG: hypothetical protein B6D65_00735 [candidate division Zixibacteria bacterium 4484_93]